MVTASRSEYMRAYRAKKPKMEEKHHLLYKLRLEAYKRLAALHPQEYDQILAEVLAEDA